MDLYNKKKIAIIDSCQFSLAGLTRIFQHEEGLQENSILYCFDHVDAMLNSQQQFDIIIYEPLHANDFEVRIEENIQTVKRYNPSCHIYIYSACVGFMKIDQVDGAFNKNLSLSELTRIFNIIVCKESGAQVNYKLHVSLYENEFDYLTSEEVSVLRGYASNLKTKQIARFLNCEVKTIYTYKKKAMDKLQLVRGSFFYKNISCILN